MTDVPEHEVYNSFNICEDAGDISPIVNFLRERISRLAFSLSALPEVPKAEIQKLSDNFLRLASALNEMQTAVGRKSAQEPSQTF